MTFNHTAKIQPPSRLANTCPASPEQSVPDFAPTTGRRIFSLTRKKRNVALLPVAYLNFVYTRIFHPAPTSPDLLPLYRPLAEESIGIGHLHPTFSFSSFSIFLSLLLYLFFRKDIYYYNIARAIY